MGASLAGEVENMKHWKSCDVVLASICLSGFAVMLATIVRRMIEPIKVIKYLHRLILMHSDTKVQ